MCKETEKRKKENRKLILKVHDHVMVISVYRVEDLAEKLYCTGRFK